MPVASCSRFCQPSRHWLTWRRLGGWHSVAAEWSKAGDRDELRVLWLCGVLVHGWLG